MLSRVKIVDANELKEQQAYDAELGIIRAWLEHPETVPDSNELMNLLIRMLAIMHWLLFSIMANILT